LFYMLHDAVLNRGERLSSSSSRFVCVNITHDILKQRAKFSQIVYVNVTWLFKEKSQVLKLFM
jgi:hypothetical protein